jgi:hypothetical protein
MLLDRVEALWAKCFKNQWLSTSTAMEANQIILIRFKMVFKSLTKGQIILEPIKINLKFSLQADICQGKHHPITTFSILLLWIPLIWTLLEMEL